MTSDLSGPLSSEEDVWSLCCTACRDDQLLCNSRGACLPAALVFCDGIVDCDDGTDEPDNCSEWLEILICKYKVKLSVVSCRSFVALLSGSVRIVTVTVTLSYYQFFITHYLFHSRLKPVFCKSFKLQPFLFMTELNAIEITQQHELESRPLD